MSIAQISILDTLDTLDRFENGAESAGVTGCGETRMIAANFSRAVQPLITISMARWRERQTTNGG